MRYRIHFINGNSVAVSEQTKDSMLNGMGTAQKNLDQIVFTYENLVIFPAHITHITPEDPLDGAGTVVKPQSPESVAEAKAKEQDSIKSDPDAILKRTKEKLEI